MKMATDETEEVSMLQIEQSLEIQRQVGEHIQFSGSVEGGYTIHTPFIWGDGDLLLVVMEYTDSGVMLTDIGDTASRAWMASGKDATGRQRAMAKRNVEDCWGGTMEDGAICFRVDRSRIGATLFDFIQCCYDVHRILAGK